jgi:glucose-6-phosphate dehydrogenase assembly protein OpcA
MTASASLDQDFTPVALAEVERELSRRMKAAHGAGEAPVIQARMSNLVVFCTGSELAQKIAAGVPAVVMVHPARVLLLVAGAGTNGDGVSAGIRVQEHRFESKWICSEQVLLRATEQAADRLPFAVRSLLIGDLPTNVWWAPQQPPAFAGPFLHDLSDQAQQLIYDSTGWLEPPRAVAGTAPWLERFDRDAAHGRWRVASDLNWRRLKHWRRLVSQALDPASTPGAIDSITEILVEHGPHAVVQAWELIGWLASCLGWRVQAARLEPNVEISWDVNAPHGRLRVRIRRLAEGPPEIRHIRIACTLEGKPGALQFSIQDESLLAVVPEGVPGAARTVAFQRATVAELLGGQLSDREPDPIFRRSMEVAQVFAHSLLR